MRNVGQNHEREDRRRQDRPTIFVTRYHAGGVKRRAGVASGQPGYNPASMNVLEICQQIQGSAIGASIRESSLVFPLVEKDI